MTIHRINKHKNNHAKSRHLLNIPNTFISQPCLGVDAMKAFGRNPVKNILSSFHWLGLQVLKKAFSDHYGHPSPFLGCDVLKWGGDVKSMDSTFLHPFT